MEKILSKPFNLKEEEVKAGHLFIQQIFINTQYVPGMVMYSELKDKNNLPYVACILLGEGGL